MKEFIEGFNEGRKYFGETIAILVNSLLLTVVYFLGFGLTSVFGKIFRKSFLELTIDKNKDSYWSKLELIKKPIKEYYRQF